MDELEKRNLEERNLLELFKEFNKNRIDYNDRKWETVKFFEGIFTTLTVALMGGIITAVKLNVIDNVLVLIGLLSLPICSCIALYFGMRNLERESRLLFIEEASMFKILKIISIPHEVPVEKRWIPGDGFLLAPRYRDYKYGIGEMKKNPSFDEWLDLRTRHHDFLRIINLVFKFEILLSIFVIFGIICYLLFMHVN